MAKGSSQSDTRTFAQLWHENHGNVLLGVLVFIILVGAIIMLWPRKRLQPTVYRGSVFSVPADSEDENGDTSSQDSVNGELTDTSVLPPDTSLLMVRILGLDNDRGKVRVALYSDADSFNQPDRAMEKVDLAIEGAETVWKVQVPSGKAVAICAYHDQNENEQLDKNLLGIPVEKYGFSLGERSPRGPPPFEAAAFEPEPGIIDVPLQVW